MTIGPEWVADLAEKELFLRAAYGRLVPNGRDIVNIQILTVSPGFIERNNRARKLNNELYSWRKGRPGRAVPEPNSPEWNQILGPEEPWSICLFEYQDSMRTKPRYKADLEGGAILRQVHWDEKLWWPAANALLQDWEKRISPFWLNSDAVICASVGESQDSVGDVNMLVLQHLIRMQERMTAHLEHRRKIETWHRDNEFWDLTSDRIDGVVNRVTREFKQAGLLISSMAASLPIL